MHNQLKYAVSIWNEVSPLLGSLEMKLAEVMQNFPESSQEVDSIFSEMASKFHSLDEGINKILQTGELPNAISLASNSRERSDGEVTLLKKVQSLQQDLTKTFNQNKISIYKALKSIPGIKVFNE